MKQRNLLFYLQRMSKRKKNEDEISQRDCPDYVAKSFPGKFSRNHPSGTLMSREDWKADQVRRWVQHFSDNPKYENTSLANKVMYLVRHLKLLKVKTGEARTLLVKVESDYDDNREVEGVDREGGGADQVEEGGDDGANQVEEDDLIEVGDQVEEGEQIEGGNIGGEGEVHDQLEDMEVDEESDSEVEFGDDDEDNEERRGLVDFEVKKYLAKTDHELFESDLVIPVCVENSRKFKARRREFVRLFLEEKEWSTSQEILENLSQAPVAVQPTLRKNVVHLTKREKASRLIVKTLSDTIKRLKETGGREAREQVQIITAAITHHRYD